MKIFEMFRAKYLPLVFHILIIAYRFSFTLGMIIEYSFINLRLNNVKKQVISMNKVIREIRSVTTAFHEIVFIAYCCCNVDLSVAFQTLT